MQEIYYKYEQAGLLKRFLTQLAINLLKKLHLNA